MAASSAREAGACIPPCKLARRPPQAQRLALTPAPTLIQPGVVYPSITVPQTSELIFANKDIAINVGVIYIHGSLRMGGPACRMTSRVTITFPASKTLKPLYQGIFLQEGGQLDIHGKLFTPTWTRLAKTANPGDTVISLQDAVNWQAGQQIFITTTIWRDEDMNQNEVLVIKAVSADGRQLTLGGAVKYSHYGGPEYQAEVGLLSRNILLQGDPSTYNTLRGGQVKIMGQGRIRGTQAYRMGQYNIVGAAPFHWYMTGASPNSTVTDSSVYRSFYRCYEFHAVSQMRIASNVAFDAPGHCFQFENGVEENHTVDRNLAAFVHPIGQAAGGITQAGNVYKQSDQLPNPSDASASGFFFPSAFNRITNNAASGGWAGFMFPVLLSPIQENQAQTYINPSTRPFIRFDGNSAHSSGYMWSEGACIYAGGRLYTNYSDAAALYFSSGRYDHATRDASGANSDFMRFSITKVFLCQSGLTHFGDRAEVDGLRAYDCTRGATLTGQALLTNSLINLQSGNAQSGFPGDLTTLWPLAGFEFPESGGMTIITNTTFANFKYQPQQGATRQAVFRAAVNTDEFKPSGSAATRNISYINTAPQAIFNIRVGQAGSSRFANWLDTDGSAVQRPGAAIVGSWPEWWHLSSAYCNYQDAWNAWVCSQQAGQAVARLDMRISGLTIAPGQGIGIPPTPAATIGTAGLFGQPGYTVDITTNEGTVGVTGSTGWFATFTAGAPQNLAIALTQVPTGTSIMFATPYPTGTTFAIQRTASPASLMGALSPATSLDAVTGGNGMQYSFDGKNLFIKLVDPGDASSAAGNFVRDGVTIYGSRGWTLVYQIRSSLQCGSYPNAICPLPAGSVAIPAPVPRPCLTCVSCKPRGHTSSQLIS
ncbi:hypothetical protein WJX72_002989 [[Myrmecia] bisecta]|uniref:G8 domain-containing protein n=1 Tax=[Myrmecia] bisecta TaxID=41462 RepID=A0AAW1P708_9CHLO